MSLVSLDFQEYVKTPREWILNKASFNKFNLITGKNASGKTRLLSVIKGLANILSNKQKELFHNGVFIGAFLFEESNYIYELKINNHNVEKEKLTVDGEIVLDRFKSGQGKIKAVEIGKKIRFQTPTNQLAAVYRRDSIQHPYLENLYQWASNTKLYHFGSEFGHKTLGAQLFEKENKLNIDKNDTDPNHVFEIFQRGYDRHKNKFKESILNDFAYVGYDCSDIKVTRVGDFVKNNPNLICLAVQEKDLNTITPQITMSQGMYRALALIIAINYHIFNKIPITLLVDDIGEGLDFERSTKIISLLMEKIKKPNFQTFLTTNDKFVMNSIPLEFWSVLHRKGNVVEIYNSNNAKEAFENFKFIGLANFDFFSNDYFIE